MRCVSGPAVASCPYVRQRCMSAVLGMQHVLAMPRCGIGACDLPLHPPLLPGGVSAGTGLRAGAALLGKIVFYFVFFGNLGRIARPHA